MGKELGMAKTIGAAFGDGKAVSFHRGLLRAKRKKGRDEGIARFEGLAEAAEEVRLAVIKAVQGPDVEKDLFLGDFIAIFVGNADSVNEAEIVFTVVFIEVDKHRKSLLLTESYPCAYSNIIS